MSKILDVGTEEIAQSQEGTYHFDICRRIGILDSQQFVCTGLDAFRCEHKPEIADTVVAEDALVQINLQVVVF